MGKPLSEISPQLMAQALHAARDRCGMCGRTVDKHGIALVVDHKIPRDWGGPTESGNLWAICRDCSQGKKDYFKSVFASWMPKVIVHKSLHVRLGETLKAFKGEPVPAATLEFIANQGGWKRRIRDLRYLGWDYKTFNRKLASGRASSFYRLVESKPWPHDPTGEIRRCVRERAQRNKAQS